MNVKAEIVTTPSGCFVHLVCTEGSLGCGIIIDAEDAASLSGVLADQSVRAAQRQAEMQAEKDAEAAKVVADAPTNGDAPKLTLVSSRKEGEAGH